MSRLPDYDPDDQSTWLSDEEMACPGASINVPVEQPPVEPLVVFALFHAEVGSDECNPLVDLFRTEEAACRRLDEETLDYEVEALESGQVEYMGASLDHLVEGSAWGNFDNEPFAWWIQRVVIID